MSHFEILELSLRDLKPPHGPRLVDLLSSLVEDMRELGWRGRPLLAVEDKEGIHLLTGSHRFAAAIEVGLESVPVYLMQADEGPEWERLVLAVDNWEILNVLQSIGDEDAISLMKIELSPPD